MVLVLAIAGLNANAQTGMGSDDTVARVQEEALNSELAWDLLASVGQMRKLGMPVIDLNQDASRYFDLHHTANDTLDKVDPQLLRQNLAAWVTLVYVTTSSHLPFGPVEPSD